MRRKYPCGYGQGWLVSGALAMYCHNLAGFIIIAPNIFLLMKRKWQLLFKLCIAQAAIFLLAAPWLLMVPWTGGKDPGGGSGRRGPGW